MIKIKFSLIIYNSFNSVKIDLKITTVYSCLEKTQELLKISIFLHDSYFSNSWWPNLITVYISIEIPVYHQLPSYTSHIIVW